LGRRENRQKWRPYLRHGARRARPEKSGPPKSSIAHRPDVINRRERDGDWEGDTLHARRRHEGALVTLVERRTGYLEMAKAEDLRSATVNAVIHRRLKRHPPELRKSCTLDNGPEFSVPKPLERQLGLKTYFAQPHCPWQRGTNENTNGLIREYFPKGTVFRDVDPRDVSRVATSLNDRPRKRLGYRTPREAFTEACYRAIQT
jgi:IS30 family transposase